MKKSILIALLAILTVTTSCGQSGAKKTTAAASDDKEVVNVYYFHGKQRCKTCIAVGDLAKSTVAEAYAGNNKVKFVEVNTSDKQNEKLVEKYEVTWNALIIARGDNSVDITEEAFANAINKPHILAGLIKEKINERLK